MIRTSLLFCLLGLFVACNSTPETIVLRREKVVKTTKTKVIGNKKMTVEIEGMTCEMGCGGSIRKALKETGGVERVQYDFVEGRKKQVAIVTYNDQQVSPKEALKLIETINEKQFTAKLISDEALNN
ncbi:MAG: heavy-metal-associated domain-containing protein [Crocinitomicaceae bacterium]|nr:heavy-metal-associated domain-containing protein [Crocinitomicaceae bacterium]